MRTINYIVPAFLLALIALLSPVHAQDDDIFTFTSKFPLTASTASGFNLESTGSVDPTATATPSGFGIGSGGSPANFTTADDDAPSGGDILRLGVGILVGGLAVALGGMT